MSLQTLPDDICCKIISLLDFKDIFNVTLICKRWQQCFHNDYIWRINLGIKYPHIAYRDIKYLSYKSMFRLLVYFNEINSLHVGNGVNPYVLQGINVIEYEPKFTKNVLTDIMRLYIETNAIKYVIDDNLIFYMKYPEIFKMLVEHYELKIFFLIDNRVLNYAIDTNNVQAINLIISNIYTPTDRNVREIIERAMVRKKYSIVKLFLNSEKLMLSRTNIIEILKSGILQNDKYINDIIVDSKFFHPKCFEHDSYIVNIKDDLNLIRRILDHPDFNNYYIYSALGVSQVDRYNMYSLTNNLFKYACANMSSALFHLLVNHPKVDPSLGSEFFIKHNLDLGYILNNRFGMKNIHNLIYYVVLFNRIDLLISLIENYQINFNKINIDLLLMNMKEDNDDIFAILMSKISTLDKPDILGFCSNKPKCMKILLNRSDLTYNVSEMMTCFCVEGCLEAFLVFIEFIPDKRAIKHKDFMFGIYQNREDIALELYKLDHIRNHTFDHGFLIKNIMDRSMSKLLKEVLCNSPKNLPHKHIIKYRTKWNSDTFYVLLKYTDIKFDSYINTIIQNAVKHNHLKLIKLLLTKYEKYVYYSDFLACCNKRYDMNLDLFLDKLINKLRYNIKSSLEGENLGIIKNILKELKSSIPEEEYLNIKQVRRIALWLSHHNRDLKLKQGFTEFMVSDPMRLELQAIGLIKYKNVCRKYMGDSLYTEYLNLMYGLETNIVENSHTLIKCGTRNIIRMIQNKTINLQKQCELKDILNVDPSKYYNSIYEELMDKLDAGNNLVKRYAFKDRLVNKRL